MADYYFNSSGNDSTGNGSLATPWATLSKAVASSTTGDNLRCNIAGNYAYAACSNRNIYGIVPTAASFFLPTVNFTSGLGQTFSANSTTNFYYVTMNGGTIASDNTSLFTTGNNNGVNTTFTQCRMTGFSMNTGQGGAYFGGHNTSGLLTLDRCVLDLNTATGNYNSGFFGGGDSDIFNIKVLGSLFYSTAANSLPIIGRCNSTSGTFSYQMKNNIFVTTVARTFFTNITGNTNLANNGFPTSCATNDNFGYTSVPTGLSPYISLTSDPLLIDPAGGNYLLRPFTSPARGAGTP